MDFFLFDKNRKIVEHWDAMQQIPEFTKNGNTMFSDAFSYFIFL